MKIMVGGVSALTLCSLALAAGFRGADQAPEPAGSGVITLQLHVNALLLPVVVRNAQGQLVGNLKQEDFKVYDQGKERPIVGFTVEHAGAADAEQVPSPSTPPPAGVSGGGAVPPAPGPRSQTPRLIVFLFDYRHLEPGALEQVKTASMRLFDQPFADSDRGLVLSFTGVNSGITHRREPLQAAIMKLKASEVHTSSSQECPSIDYYAADQILNKRSKSEWDIAYEQAANCSHQSSRMGAAVSSQGGSDDVSQLVRTAASLALETGNQDVRATLAYCRDVIHTMSNFPGQRALILVSPGFFAGTDEGLFLRSQIVEMAASSHVTISALDARGLFSSFVSASNGATGSVYAGITGQPVQDRLQSMRANEDVLSDLADGTGGTFYHNGNDLTGGLKALMAGPQYLYMLELSLENVKQNGANHALKVEVDKPGMKLQARKGYFAPMPPKNR